MSDLTFHVRQFVPGAQGEDLENRVALLKARDCAAALRGRTDSVRACNYACDAHEAAGAFVYAEVRPALLNTAVKYCRHLVIAALLAERLDAEGGEL